MNNYLCANTTTGNNNNAKIYIVSWTGNIMKNEAEYFIGGGSKIYKRINTISVMKKIKHYSMTQSDWCQAKLRRVAR